MSPGLGPFAGLHVVFAEQVKKSGLFEFERSIGLAVLIDQQGELDSCFLAKSFCILHIAESHGCQMGPLLAKCLFMLAQLRDVLTAKDSAVVAQEDQHHGMLGPQGAQTHGIGIAIG